MSVSLAIALAQRSSQRRTCNTMQISRQCTELQRPYGATHSGTGSMHRWESGAETRGTETAGGSVVSVHNPVRLGLLHTAVRCQRSSAPQQGRWEDNLLQQQRNHSEHREAV